MSATCCPTDQTDGTGHRTLRAWCCRTTFSTCTENSIHTSHTQIRIEVPRCPPTYPRPRLLAHHPSLFQISTQSSFPLSPWRPFTTATALLGSPRSHPMIPLPVSWGAKRSLHGASTVITDSGLTAYVLSCPGTTLVCTYRDGSRIGSPPASGACAVLPDGRIVVCQVPGPRNSYKAEVMDGGPPGHLFQERSDEYAKYGSTHPFPPPATPSTPWDIIRHRELLSPPHRVWTHDLSRTHTHDHFCSSSAKPLKKRRSAWHKWLFGLQSRRGYAHHATFWKDDISPTPCSHCEHRHNTSVHGYVAHCSHAHPPVHAWTSAWPDLSTPTRWRSTAHRHDLRIAGPLGVSVSLSHALSTAHGGPGAARKIVYKWQRAVLDSVTAVPSESIPAPSSKPNPFTLSDWNDSVRPV